jgi:hypothetical protein
MIQGYGLTALVLFLIHLATRARYRRTVTRCAIWAALWPLDVAICVREWLRHGPRGGGDINTAALALRLREHANRD